MLATENPFDSAKSIVKKALAFLKHEIAEMLSPTILFLIAFHVVTFARTLHGLRVTQFMLLVHRVPSVTG